MGTEYTLQGISWMDVEGCLWEVGLIEWMLGVMRFLQTEWHKHERDRNSWEIERAEMKARIAKMEGENRAARRLQQGLMTRIKMLETALKKKAVEEGKVQNSEGNLTSLKCRLGPGMGFPRDGWTLKRVLTDVE